MTNFTKIFSSIFCLSLIASCGKKSGLSYDSEKTQQKKFERVIEENDFNNSDKNFKYYFDREQPKKKSNKKPKPKKRGNLDYFDKKPEKEPKKLSEEDADEYDTQQDDEYESENQ